MRRVVKPRHVENTVRFVAATSTANTTSTTNPVCACRGAQHWLPLLVEHVRHRVCLL